MISRKAFGQSGFTLVEVVLALMIVVFVVMMIVNLPPSLGLIGKSKQEGLAKDIASTKLENLRSQGFDSLANGTSPLTDTRLSSLPEGSGEVIVEDCPETVCTNGEIAKKVGTKVEWKHSSGVKSIELTTIISKGGLK